jgi:hypothetical protein
LMRRSGRVVEAFPPRCTSLVMDEEDRSRWSSGLGIGIAAPNLVPYSTASECGDGGLAGHASAQTASSPTRALTFRTAEGFCASAASRTSSRSVGTDASGAPLFQDDPRASMLRSTRGATWSSGVSTGSSNGEGSPLATRSERSTTGLQWSSLR